MASTPFTERGEEYRNGRVGDYRSAPFIETPPRGEPKLAGMEFSAASRYRDGRRLRLRTMTFGDLLVYLELLLLLGVANGTPLFTNTLLRRRFNRPLDGGTLFVDGRPLFGPSKTVRGVVVALILTPLAAVVLGLGAVGGLLIALFAMIGDLFSSFTKRRLGRHSSSQALGLDQIPESLFPLIAVRERYDLDAVEIAALVVVFVVLELILSRVLFRLRLRDQPY